MNMLAQSFTKAIFKGRFKYQLQSREFSDCILIPKWHRDTFPTECLGVLNGVTSKAVVPQKEFYQESRVLGTELSHAHMHHLCPHGLLCRLWLWVWTTHLFLKSPSPLGHKSLSPFTFPPTKEHHPSYFLLSLVRAMNKAFPTALSSIAKEHVSSPSC